MKGSECKFVKYMEGSDKRFVIPVYQRNYDWKTENCNQLYDAICCLDCSWQKLLNARTIVIRSRGCRKN